MGEFNLAKVRRRPSYEDSYFQSLYEKLIVTPDSEWSQEQKENLLRYGAFFFGCEDGGLKRLGYRIISHYSNYFGDYIPLFDTALNAGFIPISKFIESKHLANKATEDSFFRLFQASYLDLYRNGDKWLSEGQKALFDFSQRVEDALIVAPTSYGKSEMMIWKVKENIGSRICLIVPSKALLAQTKRRLLEDTAIATRAKRIITHPEMLRPSDESFVAVFTQERLLRAMQNDANFYVDILLVDEAHNMLEKGERGKLLLQMLLVAKHRNELLELKFYTPFIADAESIETPYSRYKLASQPLDEFIKIERYYVFDVSSGEYSFYDQFMDRHIGMGQLAEDEFDFIKSHNANKNIVYLNKPRDVEDVANKLSKKFAPLETDDKGFREACDAIAEFIAPEYKLLIYLKRGVLYHHGRIPEIVRLYIERLYREYDYIPYIVTNSTLLEGVNIPAEKLFLLSTKRGRGLLSRSAFKNLTGRICRFSELFSMEGGNLHLLAPEVYVVKAPKYNASNYNPYTFLERRAKVQPAQDDEDEVENILLIKEPQEDQRDELKDALEYLENLERGVLENCVEGFEFKYTDSEIGQSCFRHNVYEFDIHANEEQLRQNLETVSGKKLGDARELLNVIHSLFIEGIDYKDNESEFLRLQNPPARAFYTMVLEWKLKGAAYKEMIASYLGYWRKKKEAASSHDDYLVYVGHSWGEKKRLVTDFVEQYIDLREKTKNELINLAIVKIKDEQDFLEFRLMKFIDVMSDLELLETNFYDNLKYGSSDPKTICLLKNGVSMDLARCLISGEYSSYIDFKLEEDRAVISSEAIEAMMRNNENKILIFEAEFHAQA